VSIRSRSRSRPAGSRTPLVAACSRPDGKTSAAFTDRTPVVAIDRVDRAIGQRRGTVEHARAHGPCRAASSLRQADDGGRTARPGDHRATPNAPRFRQLVQPVPPPPARELIDNGNPVVTAPWDHQVGFAPPHRRVRAQGRGVRHSTPPQPVSSSTRHATGVLADDRDVSPVARGFGGPTSPTRVCSPRRHLPRVARVAARTAVPSQVTSPRTRSSYVVLIPTDYCPDPRSKQLRQRHGRSPDLHTSCIDARLSA